MGSRVSFGSSGVVQWVSDVTFGYYGYVWLSSQMGLSSGLVESVYGQVGFCVGLVRSLFSQKVLSGGSL